MKYKSDSCVTFAPLYISGKEITLKVRKNPTSNKEEKS